MELAGKVALITGGGTGIGRATSLLLAREGVTVAVNYSRSALEAAETVQMIAAAGGRALAVHADVSDDRQVRSLVEQVISQVGGIDLLVTSAGTTRFIPLKDLEAVADDDWEHMLGVNVRGIFYCARAVAPSMRARGGGAIVTISSVAGYTGDGSSLPYAVSKAAAIGLTRSLARALAPQIRVCGVAPGIVETRWTAGQEEHVRRLGAASLLERNATPEDVAAMVRALLVQEAMSGQTVVVDGGRVL